MIVSTFGDTFLSAFTAGSSRLIGAGLVILALTACTVQSDEATGDGASKSLAAETEICTNQNITFEQRKAALAKLSYKKVSSSRGAMWIEAQVIHIAMTGVGDGATNSVIKDTYKRFRKLADANDLFHKTGPFQHYKNESGSIELSISNFGNDAACSIAFKRGTPVLSPGVAIEKVNTADAGKYIEYKTRHGVTARSSVTSGIWDQWIGKPRRSAGFLVVSKDKGS